MATAPERDATALATLAVEARDRRRRELEERIATDTELVESLSERLRQAVRRVHLARRDLAEVDGHRTAIDGQAEIERIRRLPLVRDVTASPDGLGIETRPILVESDGQTYDLGCFRVLIGLQDGVRVDADRDDRASGWIHPHVQGGRPCLGNVRVGVEKSIGLGELLAATQLVLAFLATYDAEHAYCPIARWPRVEPSNGHGDAIA
jgi:hypothetical protein